MTPGEEPDELSEFLKKVLEIQLAEPGDQLSEDRLKEIAERAGVGAEDWERVCRKLDEHLEKGRNFLLFENYPDAILELDQAVSIAPYRPDVLLDSGRAYAGFWRTTAAKSARRNAENRFVRCLAIEPANQDAAEELSLLKRKPDKPDRFGKKSVASGLVGTALLAACGVFAWMAFSKPSAPPSIEAVPIIEEATASERANEFLDTSEIFDRVPDATFVNSLEMAFLPVPIYDGQTQISTLLFSRFETRIKDYRAFVDDSSQGDSTSAEESWSGADEGYSDEHPVTYVNWHEAKAFCEWLTLREREAGRIGLGDRYRLPTDHEWSCAIGIGQVESPKVPPKYKHNALRDVFPWGDDWPPATVLGNYRGPETESREIAPTLPDAYVKAAPVGSFPLTHWGLSDVGGNVWEWCEDQWDVDMHDEKAVRGGSFNTQNGNHILAAGRRWIMSRDKKEFIGFRIVLERDAEN